MMDSKTGSITLSETRHIKAGDNVDLITALQLGDVQQVVDLQNGWKWLSVKNLRVDEQYYILSFGFQADALKQIQLIVSKDRFALTANWDFWSEQDELDSLAAFRTWIKKELGREGAFDWGTVRAAYDRKGGNSSINITYK